MKSFINVFDVASNFRWYFLIFVKWTMFCCKLTCGKTQTFLLQHSYGGGKEKCPKLLWKSNSLFDLVPINKTFMFTLRLEIFRGNFKCVSQVEEKAKSSAILSASTLTSILVFIRAGNVAIISLGFCIALDHTRKKIWNCWTFSFRLISMA